MNKTILVPAFILMVIAQWYIPGSMIYQSEKVLTDGTVYKFKTAPVDPNDPFRGKYITLYFNANTVVVDSAYEWSMGDQAYAILETDSAGFARIQGLSKVEIKGQDNYIKVDIDYVQMDSITTVFVRYPFDRFYMEETKAPLAEQAYNEAARDTNQVAYALVMVRTGEAMVKDVIIDDLPITEWIKKNHPNQE